MTTNYPGGYDSFPTPGTNLDDPPHDELHIDVQDAVEAIQAELGLNPRGSYASVRARLDIGWQLIHTAGFTVESSVAVPITGGPYRMIHVVLSGTGSETDSQALRCRINDDTTTNLHLSLGHRFGLDGNLYTHSGQATLYTIGYSAPDYYMCEMTLFEANVNSRLPFVASGGCFRSGSTALSGSFQSFGYLTANREITSLRFSPASGTISGRITVFGARVP